jgi:hypothetical protein
MRKFPHWVLWKFDWVEDSWAKVLYDAKTMNRAATDNPETWGSFESVAQSYNDQPESFDGIGFVFSVASDDLCGIDFDNCLDGPLDPVRQKWIERFDSYTEISVSGTGLHIIGRGVWGNGRRRKAPELEVYDRLRYFTFSGRVWERERRIRWIQPELEAFKAEMFPESVAQPKPTPITVNKTTDELLQQAFRSQNGDSIYRLYKGCISDYGDDDSAADLALCSKLAFWSSGSATILDEMFRGSGLFRAKWDKRHSADGRTYGQMTVDKALSSCTQFYSPNGNSHKQKTKVSESVTESPSKGIYRVSDLRDKVLGLYETGRQGGEHPGWDGLADFYTIKKKQFTVLTGIPGAGKSAFLDCMLVNLALRSGWKFAVTSVENQPLEDHLSVLLEIYAGQPFSEGPTSRMSLSTVNKSLDWFQEHFYFVLPDEQDRTLGGIISLVNELEVDGVVVDPWNELEHRRPAQMTETEYVSQALSRMRHHARLHDQHWWLVAHPTKLQKDKSTGKYLVPTLYDIAGSAHFRNKADFGLVVWRDADVENGPSTVFVQKVRFRWCGKLGQCDLYFDRVTGRFSEQPRVFPIGDHRNEWIGQAYEETA